MLFDFDFLWPENYSVVLRDSGSHSSWHYLTFVFVDTDARCQPVHSSAVVLASAAAECSYCICDLL